MQKNFIVPEENCWSKVRSLLPTIQLSSAEPLKYPIDKMFPLQGYVTVWVVSWVPRDIRKMLFQRQIFWNAQTIFSKSLRYPFNNVILYLQSTSRTQANSFFPTVQLHFSWTFEMRNRRDDRFTRSSEIWAFP